MYQASSCSKYVLKSSLSLLSLFHCIVLYNIVLYNIVLYNIVLYNIVLYNSCNNCINNEQSTAEV